MRGMDLELEIHKRVGPLADLDDGYQLMRDQKRFRSLACGDAYPESRTSTKFLGLEE